MRWFEYAGHNSDGFDITVTRIPPAPRPIERVTKLTIPGKSGTLTISDGVYEEVTFEVEMILRDTDRIYEVQEWLTGHGDLIVSLRPDRKYSAWVDAVDTSYFSVLHQIMVMFRCHPFVKEASPSEHIVADDTLVLINPSVFDAYPTITFDGTVVINGDTFVAATELTVDAEAMVVTKESGGETVTATADLTGYVGDLKLTPGENTSVVTGNATIPPNWRWL